MSEVLIIERQKDLPKVSGRGRKKGSGPNMKLLANLKPGDSVWDVPYNKMLSIRASAFKANIKLKVRLIPDTNLYAIQRKE